MAFSRRDFLSTLGRTAPAAWLAAGGRDELHDIAAERARFAGGPEEIARDERFWAPVQQAFTVNRAIIDLNNAGVSPSPAPGLWSRRPRWDIIVAKRTDRRPALQALN